MVAEHHTGIRILRPILTIRLKFSDIPVLIENSDSVLCILCKSNFSFPPLSYCSNVDDEEIEINNSSWRLIYLILR